MRRKLLFPVCALLFLWAGCSKEIAVPEHMKVSAQAKTQLKTAAVGASAIAGVNWADIRDNFVDGPIIPSGLDAADSYATVSAKADAILTGFQTNMPGVNTVRLPVNPSSVSQAWWDAYTGAIDMALSKNMNVILGYWEGASYRDGLIDDTTQFWSMWQTIVTKYQGNAKVYFEVFNEPHGYSLDQLTTIYAEWLSRYPNVPRGRILLDGTGYSEDVTGVGADSRFTSCLLSLHNYAFWATRTQADWEANWRSRFGSYGSRTVVTEYGAGMTTGKNYTGAVGSDNEIAYIVGSTNVFRMDGIASVYWPGLRDNDSYSIQSRGGSGTAITLSTTNASGLARILYGWGEGNTFDPSASYRLVNRNSGKVLDINGSSTTSGTAAIQWTWSGSNNQQWQIVDNGSGFFRINNRNSGQALDVGSASVSDGASVIQWPWNGGNNQQWQLIPIGGGYYEIINRNSGKALDINGGGLNDGATAIQWPWSAGNNQQWQIIQI